LDLAVEVAVPLSIVVLLVMENQEVAVVEQAVKVVRLALLHR
jgi:hypothetical protein